ncbi:uncharacterized protein NKAPD1-like isoform X1 [Mya arenaria]|uniref:uncharacterized protein NKAPD1-like isoform X1 n=1 Tax=Mya arenaria TaxID=6604 RepID=UPI0022E56A27|nr:uncharacterized protein NKAPD1-like isoform X1 [Mya arenaria]XP_052805582.1 uncharacterized protein NKAPD1-like isoform X1 [Mya arenaria]
MSNKSLVSNSSKTLLKNVIRHTDSHNKIIEENEMWRQWKTEQQGPEENNPSFLKGQCSDMRYEFPKRRNKRAYMDEEPQSTFWMKELYKTEEADENSPDLAPMDFWVFPEVKRQLRGQRFEDVNKLKIEAQRIVGSFPEDWYMETYDKWISRHRKSLQLNGDYRK